jgi:hypothetical protein
MRYEKQANMVTYNLCTHISSLLEVLSRDCSNVCSNIFNYILCWPAEQFSDVWFDFKLISLGCRA